MKIVIETREGDVEPLTIEVQMQADVPTLRIYPTKAAAKGKPPKAYRYLRSDEGSKDRSDDSNLGTSPIRIKRISGWHSERRAKIYRVRSVSRDMTNDRREVRRMTGRIIATIFNSITAVCNITTMILFCIWYGPHSKR